MRQVRRGVAIALLGVVLNGCTAEDRSAGVPPADAAAAAALRRGELLSLACQACHALTEAGGPDIGPSLYGVFGRPAASLADFQYSEALRAADFVWSAQQLDAWLQAPTDFMPGTTMVFAGYGNAEDRRMLIDWLRQATAPGTEMGEASLP